MKRENLNDISALSERRQSEDAQDCLEGDAPSCSMSGIAQMSD
jgi:hypothetical protein